MDVAELLRQSRQAHKSKQWQTALELRVAAHEQDPVHTDAAWLEDAKNVRGVEMRHPMKTTAEIALEQHQNLVRFYVLNLGG